MRDTHLIVTVVLVASCRSSPSDRPAPEVGYVDIRKEFVTELVHQGPSPQPFEPIVGTEGLKVVEYQSAAGRLKGYLALPATDTLRTSDGYPVLLYLHGGFALGAGDVADCSPFLRRGFAVLAPAFRGENGNPGSFELWFGELDDAVAALRSVAKLPELDERRVFVSGHSSGGALAALMTLLPDLPLAGISSIGGFYSEPIFNEIPRPFGDRDMEKALRLPYRWVSQLKYEHVACVGSADEWPRSVLAGVAAKSTKLRVISMPGDHLSSLPGCMEKLAADAEDQLSAAAEATASPK